MLGILRRVFSFADWTAHHPTEPVPGDMLDASFDAQNQRISELEALVSLILRSDGQLQNDTVSFDSFTSEVRGFLVQEVANAVQEATQRVFDLYDLAKDAQEVAEIAAQTAVSAFNGTQIAGNEVLAAKNTAFVRLALLDARMDETNALLEDAVGVRTDWDDSASEAQAWANASAMWAEWMPSTLPAESMALTGVTGDHWSSRWWANQAANAFGMLTSLYLGAHPVPPVTNNNGGPIEVGSIYYDTTSQQPFVWNGSQWVPFTQPSAAATMSLWYTATAGQASFPTGVTDLHGNSYILDASAPEGIDVHVNGLKRMETKAGYPGGSYTVNASTSTIVFTTPLAAGDLVGIDVLVAPNALGPGQVTTWILKPLAGKDGVKVTFALEAADASAPTVTLTKAEELIVSLDGVIQQPTADYMALGSQITFTVAPSADSKTFITWLCPDGSGSGIVVPGVPEAPIDGKQYGRKDASWTPIAPVPSGTAEGQVPIAGPGPAYAWSPGFIDCGVY
jgi:hypothetical protein